MSLPAAGRAAAGGALARSDISPRRVGGSVWAATYGLSTPRAPPRAPPCIWTFLSGLGKREFFSIPLDLRWALDA